MSFRCVCAIGLLLLAAGCGPREGITSYTVRKPELIDPTLVSAPVEAKPQQMLAAVILHGPIGWFFKLTGEPNLVEPQREEFLNLVKSIRFTEGNEPQPTWTLPSDWKQQPGEGLRFATIEIPAGKKVLELTVIPLPNGDGTSEEFLLSNVNRWRDQVSLPPIEAKELPTSTETFQVGEFDCTFVSLVGEAKAGGMGAAPFAPFAGGASAAPGSAPNERVRPKPTSASAAAGGKLTHDTPEGWTVGTTNGISVATFHVADGEKKVEITVTPLRPSALLDNVNRWRAQIKMPATVKAELAKSVKQVETLGVTGDYVELVGETETILGVIAPVGDQMWFIKLKGESTLAQRENARFQAFVKSLQLK